MTEPAALLPAALAPAALPPATARIAHIVHIGAGLGGDVPTYLAAAPTAVTLIEADAEAVAHLRGLAAQHPQISVIAAAVSPDVGNRTFRRTNFGDLNSLRAPTGLNALFPGLRILSETPVEPVDPVVLIRGLDLGKSDSGVNSDAETGENLLVIEAPGEAMDILRALDKADLLQLFALLRIQEGRAPLYKGAATAAQICDFLQDRGYEASLESAPEDCERPHLSARLDRVALAHRQEIAGLSETLTQAQQANAAQARQIETLKTGLEAARAEAAATAQAEAARAEQAEVAQAEAESALTQARQDNDARTQQIEALNTALKAARTEAAQTAQARVAQAEAESALNQTRQDSDTRAQQIEALNTTLNTALEAAQAEAAKAEQAQVAQAEAESALNQTRQDSDTRAQQIEALNTAIEAAQAQATQAEAARSDEIAGLRTAQEAADQQTRAARQDLSVAIRLQTLREVDLKDLQDRYGSLLEQKQAQDDLLRRLTASLGNAAQYLQEIGEVPPGGTPTHLKPAAKPKPRPQTRKTTRKPASSPRSKPAAGSDD